MLVFEIIGIVTSVFGVVGGLYAFWGWMRRTVFAPRPSLSYDESRTGEKARDYATKRKFVFYHIQVQNPSHTTINSARAYLLTAQRTNSEGRLVPWTDFRGKLPLPWANTGGKLDVELFGKESARIDFLTLPVDHEYLAFSSPQGPSGTAITIPSGKYLFEIRCTGANSKTVSICVTVDFSDPQKAPRIEQQP